MRESVRPLRPTSGWWGTQLSVLLSLLQWSATFFAIVAILYWLPVVLGWKGIVLAFALIVLRGLGKLPGNLGPMAVASKSQGGKKKRTGMFAAAVTAVGHGAQWTQRRHRPWSRRGD